MEFTGERLVPEVYGKIAAEHLHRYSIAINYIKNKKVLDIASGEGYGTNILAEYASSVIGVDISEDAVLHAKNKYIKENLSFHKGSALEIPFDSETFDVVVSFETLEHVSNQEKMLKEIKRVLKKDGILIISTPDKVNYSSQGDFLNPYHEKELDEVEFKNLLSREFEFINISYQKYISGSLVLSTSSKSIIFYLGDYSNINGDLDFDQDYFIAICSASFEFAEMPSSFFNSKLLDLDYIEREIDRKVKKIKSGFRYRLIDKVFWPLDFVKKIISSK